MSDCPSVTLFDSPTVFVKWLLGDQLFVDILYIFVNGTSRAIFWALSEINKLIRDPPGPEMYRILWQICLFTYVFVKHLLSKRTCCHILYMICYSQILVLSFHWFNLKYLGCNHVLILIRAQKQSLIKIKWFFLEYIFSRNDCFLEFDFTSITRVTLSFWITWIFREGLFFRSN